MDMSKRGRGKRTDPMPQLSSRYHCRVDPGRKSDFPAVTVRTRGLGDRFFQVADLVLKETVCCVGGKVIHYLK